MKLPDSVKVGYRTFHIVSHTTEAADHSGCVGYVHNATGTIGCQDYGSKVECANTLLHEILHCCMEVGHVQLDDDAEERAVMACANHLIGVMQSNPEVIRWIMRNARAEE